MCEKKEPRTVFTEVSASYSTARFLLDAHHMTESLKGVELPEETRTTLLVAVQTAREALVPGGRC